MEPAAGLEASLPAELKNYNESLVLAPDAGGRMWLLFRHRVPRIPDVSSEAALHGAAWEVWASAYEGGRVECAGGPAIQFGPLRHGHRRRS